MRVLITGGAGFIGCNIARDLSKRGWDVVALDDLSLGKRDNLEDGVPLLVGDVAEAPVWKEVGAVDAVVHLAGASSAPMFPDNLERSFHNNISGFIRVLEHARAVGARRVIYASTSSVYGNVTPPLVESGALDIPNFYAVSKYCMEQIARVFHNQYGIDVVGLRFMSVYGPREDHKGHFANLVSQFIWDVEAGRRPVVYGDGSQTRDFTNVGDIAQAVRLALETDQKLGSPIFNVGTGVSVSINQLIQVLSDAFGTPVEAEHIENPVKVGYVREQLASLELIGSVLGYRPSVSLEQGVQEILAIRKARAAVENAG